MSRLRAGSLQFIDAGTEQRSSARVPTIHQKFRDFTRQKFRDSLANFGLDQHTSATDLKSLHYLPQARPRDFKSTSGTRIIQLLVPFVFSKFVSEVAALYHELRKEGTSPESSFGGF